MPLQFKSTPSKKANTILIAFVKDKVDHQLVKEYGGLKYDIDVKTNGKDLTSFLHPEKNQRVHILGLGEEKDQAKSYTFYRSFVYQQRAKKDMVLDIITDNLTDDQIVNVVLGARLGLINHGIYKTNGDKYVEPEINIVISKSRVKIAELGLKIAETQLRSMHLVDLPPNVKTPQYLGKHVVASGKEFGYDVKVMDAKELKKNGLDALTAVGQGSANPPVLIIMEYKPKGSNSKTPKLGLVGKGITFDTGGLSIKPSTNMGYMKSDMGGAAAVIGAVELAAKLKLDIHLVGVIPAAENSVDANSYRPGDVINSYSGKSIEIIDTDAEGRVVLADGLAYILKNYNPTYLVDLATLTGNCIAALGYSTSGIFTHNDEMANDLTTAGESVHERVWRLPLWDDYAPDMHSDIADIKNFSGKPVAGAITAAKFLEAFTLEHPKWTHIDIAGVAFSDSEFAKMRTATGYGVRLLYTYMNMLINKK